MSTLIIIRPELFSVLIMIFLILYDRYCSKFRSSNNMFFRFALVDLGHCVMALVTEITVNSETVPGVVNNFCHILFFLFSLLYSLFFLEYALSLILPNGRTKKRFLLFGQILSLIAICIMVFAPIEYLTGENTKYSAGIGPTLCYLLGFVFFLTADLIILVNHKRVAWDVKMCIVPLSFVTLGLLVFQILVPEFLYTAQALTLTTVGVFFAIENPVGKFKDQAFIDADYHIWNRNGYEYDLEHDVADKLAMGAQLTFVIGDINGLKTVNDTLGHMEGDRLIKDTTAALQEKMASSYKIYKIGGDEFAAIYFDTPTDKIQQEINEAIRECAGFDFAVHVPVGISAGFASRKEGEDFSQVFRRAEKAMYEKKKEYYQMNGIERRNV